MRGQAPANARAARSSAAQRAASNFANWTYLGSVVAGTNGLQQFLDTNAPSVPWRFYEWQPL